MTKVLYFPLDWVCFWVFILQLNVDSDKGVFAVVQGSFCLQGSETLQLWAIDEWAQLLWNEWSVTCPYVSIWQRFATREIMRVASRWRCRFSQIFCLQNAMQRWVWSWIDMISPNEAYLSFVASHCPSFKGNTWEGVYFNLILLPKITDELCGKIKRVISKKSKFGWVSQILYRLNCNEYNLPTENNGRLDQCQVAKDFLPESD